MSEWQLALVLLCFWPLIAIGFPFYLFLRDERLLRFKLRTLLIATTLTALLLGLVVYMSRQ